MVKIARCGCSGSGSCSCVLNVIDTNCIDITKTGSGSAISPWEISAALRADPATATCLNCGPAGVRLVFDPDTDDCLNCGPQGIQLVIDNSNPNNLLVCGPAGLSAVSPPASGVTTLGTLGYAQDTVGQSGITTATDLTNLVVTVTVATGRRILITGYVKMGSTVATDNVRLSIFEGATLLQFSDVATGTSFGFNVPIVLTPSSGSHTYKLVAARQSGTGTVSVTAGANFPNFILVEDIGV